MPLPYIGVSLQCAADPHTSDLSHRPLVTYVDDSLVKKKGWFRFDHRLRDKEKIHQLIEDTWLSAGNCSVATFYVPPSHNQVDEGRSIVQSSLWKRGSY